MSVYRVIDVIGTSTTSWEGAAADAIRETGIRFGTFGSLKSSRGYSCRPRWPAHLPHEDPTVLQVRAASQASARLIARAPSAVIIASTEAKPLCVVAHG